MKKISLILIFSVFSVLSCHAISDPIYFNANYQITHVDKYVAACTTGDFGRALQRDLDAAPISAQVWGLYSIFKERGNVVSIAKNSKNEVILKNVLFPLGISGQYDFGDWYDQVSLKINGSQYEAYSTQFMTTGSTTEEWLNNAIFDIVFVNPAYPYAGCPVYNKVVDQPTSARLSMKSKR